MLNFLRKHKKRRKIFQAMIFIIIIAMFFVNIKFSLAADTFGGDLAGAGNYVIGGVGYAVATVLAVIALVLTTVIGLLITVVVKILVTVAQYGNIINVPTVIQGWVIIRDLCNMSFILILLIIAFATILRQENFSAKKMLPKLLLMAVLINFSRTIFGLLIDFSQVIMLTFVNAFAQNGAGNFITAFNTNWLLSMAAPTSTGGSFAVSTWSTSVAIIGGVLAAIITLIVLSVMLAVLVARIVMLWIYTIFSPLIFLGFAFTPLQKYTGKLWEDFTKQLVVGPVLAFFIWLALTTAQTSTDLLSGKASTPGAEICAGIGAFFCEGRLQQFIIVIGLLMGGLMVAQTMGGAAGSIAGKGLDWAKKSLAAPGGLARWYGKKVAAPYIGRKLEENHLGFLTPSFWKGFGTRGGTLNKRSERLAAGEGEQLAENYLHPKFWRKRKGARDMYERARMEVVNEYVSDNRKSMGVAANPRQELVNINKRAAEAPGADGDFQREAAIISASAQGNFDDVAGAVLADFVRRVEKITLKDDDTFKKKYGVSKAEVREPGMTEEAFKNKFGVNVGDITLKNGKINMDANMQRRFQAGYLNLNQAWIDAAEVDKNWRNMTRKELEEDRDKKRETLTVLLKKSDSTEQNKIRAMAVSSEAAKDVGHWEQLTTVKDNETGNYKVLTELDRLDEVKGEVAKRPTREIIQHTATHVFRPSEIDPATGEFNRSANMDNMGFFETETSKNLWKGQVLGDIHQSPPRTSEHLYGVYFDEKGVLITDPEVCKKLGFIDENGEGSAEKLKDSMERAKELNHQIINALYLNKYFGRKGGVPYGEPNWQPVP